jgi:hypothetical protein
VHRNTKWVKSTECVYTSNQFFSTVAPGIALRKTAPNTPGVAALVKDNSFLSCIGHINNGSAGLPHPNPASPFLPS